MGQERPHVGIDPGQTGAVALIAPLGMSRHSVKLTDTPTLKGDGKTLYDEPSMAAVLREILREHPDVFVTIEQVHAMSKQGVSSTFKFGMGYGVWLGIIATLGIPSERVSPQRWKKAVLADGPKVDQAVVAFAGRLYPQCAPAMLGPRGALLLGRADALLIGHYGMRARAGNSVGEP